MNQSTLYLVSVPIGNLGDITLRAIKILKEVDFIVVEDTRYSIKLLNHLKIKKKMYSYYKPREIEKTDLILNKLKNNKKAALITDSGTPVISDPGFFLIKAAIKENITIIPLPGPSALLPGLISSGIKCEKFLFLGFLPKKNSQLKSELIKICKLPYTMIFYESPRRLHKFLSIAYEVFNNREFCVCKEISKKHEKFIRGNLEFFNQILENETILGEIVVVVEGAIIKDKKDQIKIEKMDDIYNYFKNKHQIPKNQIKAILQKKR